MSFLQKLLGLPSEEAADVAGGSLRFAPMVPVAAIVALAAVLALLAWLAYRQTPEDVPAGRRRLMALLRAVFFALLLGLLLRPVLALTLEREERRAVAVLVDSSASMSISDPRDRAEDRARAAIATGTLAPAAGLGTAPPSAADPTRSELAADALANSQLALLEKLGEKADLNQYGFGAVLSAGADMSPEAPETALGDALIETLRRHSADDLAAVFVVSDGASNEGRNPLSAAAALRERGVKVFTYGVGVTGSSDISIDALDLPAVALAEDAIPVTVRVKHRGLAGTRARVVVTLSGAAAADREFELDGSGEQEITLAVVPGKPGEFDIEARVETSEGEVLEDNNSLSRGIRVLDSAIRVLMVESSPRWEFKYIQAMLLRERRIELKCFLAGVDPEVTRIPDSPYIADFPDRREDLFGFDLILFGDIDPEALPDGAVANIASFVSDGGGSLAILAGKRFTPLAYRSTDLERLLPIDLAPTRVGAEAAATRPVRLQLTDAGANAGFLNLETDPSLARTRWAKLPPIYWMRKADRAKPAAETYLVHPDGGWPVVAWQRYGAGEVLWVGTDNTWRWRKNTGDLYHTRFWGQVVQKLAGRRLATGSRRSELRSDRAVARQGERFTVFARLLDESFQPRTDETVSAVVEASGDLAGESRRVTLRAVPGSPGYYRAEFPAGDPGRYRLSLPDDKDGGIDLNVRGADREFAETAMNESLLRGIAETTGGAFLREEDLYTLPELAATALEPTKVSIAREAELWNSPLYFILLLLPITLEWVLRKLSELK